MDTYDIAAAFAEIEEELIDSMIRNMRRHRVEEISEDKEWAQWQAEQLKALELYKKQNPEKFAGRYAEINDLIDKAIREAKAQGNMDQEIEILEAIKKGFKGYKKSGKGLMGEFFQMNDRKLEALIKATQNDFQKGEYAILRMAEDQYRQVIYNAQVYANTGAGTYEQAVDTATKDFLSRGINCIQYANGARHTMRDYADMAIRTANKRAYLAGEGEMRAEWGIATVIVNKRQAACPKCMPFCGKVFIDDVWSGGEAYMNGKRRNNAPVEGLDKNTGKTYPLLSRAIAAGLYHPGCKDVHTTYFPGISTMGDGWTDEELEKVCEDYRQEQKQQYAERQAEKYERLAKYSLDEDNQKGYKQKAKQWENVAKPSDSDIIKSGARITDPESKAGQDFAKLFYPEIRKRTTDCQKIADNLGKEVSDIQKIKDYLFMNDSLYDEDLQIWRKFDEDCAIAQSWQRLTDGKNIKQHDRTLIEHELYEMKLKAENPDLSHDEAHTLAQSKYNYKKEVTEYYDNLNKSK